MTRDRTSWMNLGWEAWALGLEAASVIQMRTLKIATGGSGADAEALRMVSEKVDAAMALNTMAITGALGLTPASAAAKTLRHYRRKVRANRKRLG